MANSFTSLPVGGITIHWDNTTVSPSPPVIRTAPQHGGYLPGVHCCHKDLRLRYRLQSCDPALFPILSRLTDDELSHLAFHCHNLLTLDDSNWIDKSHKGPLGKHPSTPSNRPSAPKVSPREKARRKMVKAKAKAEGIRKQAEALEQDLLAKYGIKSIEELEDK